MITCPTCNGTGQCTGNYLHETFFGSRYNVLCQNGMCPRCKGTGYDDALIFQHQCSMCGGSRYCPFCRGTGKCGTCNGTGRATCNVCGGKR